MEGFFSLLFYSLKYVNFLFYLSIFPQNRLNSQLPDPILVNPEIENCIFGKLQECSGDCAAYYALVLETEFLLISLFLQNVKISRTEDKHFLEIYQQKMGNSSNNRKIYHGCVSSIWSLHSLHLLKMFSVVAVFFPLVSV